LNVVFPLIDASEKLEAKVAWCAPRGDGFELGLAFTEADEAFRGRMCEQICHIEQYRLDVRAQEGRELSAEAAVTGWIEKFAAEFPR